jgi:hypothetical protein
MTTDPVPARPHRAFKGTPDPDNLPIDPADVTQKPLDRERIIVTEPVATNTSKR